MFCKFTLVLSCISFTILLIGFSMKYCEIYFSIHFIISAVKSQMLDFFFHLYAEQQAIIATVVGSIPTWVDLVLIIHSGNKTCCLSVSPQAISRKLVKSGPQGYNLCLIARFPLSTAKKRTTVNKK